MWVYGCTVLLGEREFVGENIKATVDLHGIGVDDFDGEVRGHIDGQLRLAGAGGARYHHHLRLLPSAVARV